MIFRLRPPAEGRAFAGLLAEEVLRYPGIMLRCRDPGGDPIGGEPEIVHILGNVEVEQLERFIGVFSTAGAEARGRHGNRGAQLCRVLIVARDGQGLSANRFWGFGVRKR